MVGIVDAVVGVMWFCVVGCGSWDGSCCCCCCGGGIGGACCDVIGLVGVAVVRGAWNNCFIRMIGWNKCV